ncbi:MAG: hypothetical protein IJP16_09620 [Clostridia bacterium]|nr:hypothetical protein [Clostridia bacterium]
MQNDYTKIKNVSLAVILTATLLVLLRSLLLILGFDFEDAFFKNDALAYSLYALFILGTVLSYFFGKGIKTDFSSVEKSRAREIVLSLATAVFLLLTALYVIKLSEFSATDVKNPLKSVSYSICLPTAVLSAVYYLLRLFTKKRGTAISLLALSPVIFLSSLLLERFATVSASASSLSHFPDVMSLLVLAFYMLGEGKSFIPDGTKKSRLPSLFAVFTALTFSAIPDLITLALPSNILYFEDACYLLLKLVFIAYVIIEALLFSKSLKEIEK